MTRLGMESVPSFISEYESNLYLSITKNKKHHLLMYCSLYRRGLTLTLESFLLCIKIPIKKWPAISEALNGAATLAPGRGGRKRGGGKRGWGGLLVKSMESRLRLLTSRRPPLGSPARLSQTVNFQPYRLTPTND